MLIVSATAGNVAGKGCFAGIGFVRTGGGIAFVFGDGGLRLPCGPGDGAAEAAPAANGFFVAARGRWIGGGFFGAGLAVALLAGG